MRWQTRKACRFDLNGHRSIILHGGATTIETPSKKSKIELVLPIVTVSEANTVYSKTRLVKTGKRKGLPAREHWREAWQRHKEQKNAIHLACRVEFSKVKLPCIVKLIRLGPREMDDDNNIISMKYLRDACAELLTGDYVPGRADGDKRIKWEYAQEKRKEYGVKIEISW